jgi:hypothetical protein
MAGRSRSATRLTLVNVCMSYGPSPALSSRPEVVAAFERGLSDRATGRARDHIPEAERERLMRDGWEASRAYGIGRHAVVSPPAPLPILCATLLIEAIGAAILDQRAPLRRHPGTVVLVMGAYGLALLVTTRAERSRVRTLGLDPATAPIPTVDWSGPIQALIAAGYAVWTRARTGGWPRASTTTTAAARAIAEIGRRRAWARLTARAPVPPER